MHPPAVLHHLADLAATTAANGGNGLPDGITPEILDLTKTGEPSDWIGTSLVVPLRPAGFIPSIPPGFEAAGSRSVPAVRRSAAARRLAALDALQPTADLLRLGWVTIAGTVEFAGRERTFCFPLLAQRVRLPGGGLRFGTIIARSLPELTPLVRDPDVAARLEAGAQYGGGALVEEFGQTVNGALIARLPRLQRWIRDVVAAAGLPPPRAVLPPSEDPLTHRGGAGLVAVVGSILYVARDQFRPSVEASLRQWATRDDLTPTAFAHLYAVGSPGHGDPPAAPDGPPEPLFSPLPLNAAQAEAVRRTRHEPIVALSGPPGSGKSHTVAAIATDTVTRGGSVLVATRSEQAAAVVAGLLDRQAGPDPVRFGGTNRDELVRQVTERGAGAGDVDAAVSAYDAAVAAQALAERGIVHRLDLEASVDRAAGWDGLVGDLTSLAPRAFVAGSDLTGLTALADRCAGAPASWWGRWRARRSEARLRDAVGAAPSTPLADLRTALRCATDRRDAAELAAGQGTVLAPLWDHLGHADAAVRGAAGRVAEVETAREDRRRRGRAATGALAAALRAGRRQRRQLLRGLDGRAVVQALPLWVGTLRDVEDLLPDTPGLFDLVVLDEASQIDQVLAAGALLRARRAVVVGDPHQLRHVSFVSDEQVRRSLADHDLLAAAGILDVRRTSTLDVAAGTTPVTWLDEHYRSVPHLIEFSARRFYDGRLTVATRHPRNEATDVIDVVRVGSGPHAELDAALEQVRRHALAGRTDIALITPFRELADAVQAEILGSYSVEEVERLRLRVGTVHAFQGAEADHVVLVLGVAAGDPPGRRRFVEDPHLFNVMVTRARRSVVVVTGLPPKDSSSSDGLIEQYFAQGDRPPVPPRAGPPPSPWATVLGTELAAADLVVRTGYPVGHWSVDLCVGTTDADAVALETTVHPDGPAAHVARHRMLASAGWRIVDAYPSRWDGDPTRAAVELAGELRPRVIAPPPPPAAGAVGG